MQHTKEQTARTYQQRINNSFIKITGVYLVGNI